MKQWNLKIGNQATALTVVEEVVAILPNQILPALPGQILPTLLTQLVGQWGQLIPDLIPANVRWLYPGWEVALENCKTFAQAGWAFIEPQEWVVRAAEYCSSLPGLQAVRQVLIDDVGRLRIPTNLISVQFDPDSDWPEDRVKEQIRNDGLDIVRPLRFAKNLFQTRAPSDRPLAEFIHELQEQRTHYRYAEPELLEVIEGRTTPTDEKFGEQWQHRNIHSEAAWELTRGHGPARPVRIAVIDNGMQITHPDLKAGILEAIFFKSVGVGNAELKRHPLDGSSFPGAKNDHGTFCLGMAGARMNNAGIGVCGAAPESDLIAIACFEDQLGTQTTLARAIRYAANLNLVDDQANPEDGVDVISCSLGPPQGPGNWQITNDLKLAIEFAAHKGRKGKGIPIFWAVHNSEVPIELDQVCSHRDVIAVGESTRKDLEDDSAFGKELKFLAPGFKVYSTLADNKYGTAEGSSCAAPLVAGVAALVLAQHPDWTQDQVLERLIKSCDKVASVVYDDNGRGRHPKYGFGRINACKAVRDCQCEDKKCERESGD